MIYDAQSLFCFILHQAASPFLFLPMRTARIEAAPLTDDEPIRRHQVIYPQPSKL